ncbi:hypothetical protein [Aquimarina agarilytica]|uniref:hypothetical protein n=1 Tax=Aquimarina agarilytica TaxID=1087449 RepID=UPI0002887393|nr:hypothetical protein [Aquimarina agarilytica]
MEKTRDELKNKFKKGDKPTEVDYANFIDSYVNKLEDPYFKFNELPDATSTAKGIVEKATLTEVDAGLDKERYVTPEGAKRAVEKFAPSPPITEVNGQTGKVTIPDYTEDDTPWETISLSTGITKVGNAPRYRKKVGIVFIEGEIIIASTTAGNTDLFELKSEYRPSRSITLYTLGSNASSVKITINTNGKVTGNKNATISLSGISFIAK